MIATFLEISRTSSSRSLMLLSISPSLCSSVELMFKTARRRNATIGTSTARASPAKPIMMLSNVPALNSTMLV